MYSLCGKPSFVAFYGFMWPMLEGVEYSQGVHVCDVVSLSRFVDGMDEVFRAHCKGPCIDEG